MPLYKDIQKYAVPSDGEIKLFRALLKAFSVIGDACELHGKKYQVIFDNPLNPMAKQTQCEISDLLLFVYDEVEARFTFLQNKKAKPKYSPNGTIKIPLRQRYLLGNYPAIYPVGKYKFPRNLFKTHILESIGTLGVFYTDSSGMINMDYAIMSQMSNLGMSTWQDYDENKGGSFMFTGKKGHIRNVSGYDEILSCTDLQAFEKAIIDMKVGEPITVENYDTVQEVLDIVEEAIKKIKPKFAQVEDIIRIKREYGFKSNNNLDKNNTIKNYIRHDNMSKLNIVVINTPKAKEIIKSSQKEAFKE